LDAQVKVCRQKELDYNGVANECKKRITELHDKISILNSDKEVIATQKNSLFALAAARLDEINGKKEEVKAAESKLSECEQRANSASSEQTSLNNRVTELEASNSELEHRILEKDAQIQTLTDQLAAAAATNAAATNADPVESA